MGQPVAGGAGLPMAPVTPPDVPTRRGTELILLGFAAAVVTFALIQVELSREQALTAELFYYGAAFLGLFSVAHVAVRIWAPYADPLILPCVALLNGLGLVMIHRLDPAIIERAKDLGQRFPGYSAPRQLLWMLVGLALFAVVMWFIKDHRTLSRYGYTFGLVGLVLLALPGLLPASLSEVNGAKIWLRLGIFSIQPGEFAKILLMLFFAAFLVSKRDLFMTAGRKVLGMELPRARDMFPLLAAWFASVGVLVLEKDLGTSLLFFGILLVMLYVATERVGWLVVGMTFFIGGCLIAYQLFDHVKDRVAVWLDPMSQELYSRKYGSSFQLAQALFGVSSGGVTGTGLGGGHPERVPLSQSDFIIASMGEELGFVGLAALLMLYTVLVMRGLRSALAVRDTFGKLLAGGLSFALGLQVFIVVGGVTGLIPLTGLTAPFLSQGGSSLVANYALIALLLRISDSARRPAAPSRPPTPQASIAESHTVMVERPA